MSPDIKNGLSQLSNLFQSFSDSFGDDTRVHGEPVPDSLASTLGLSLYPSQYFWKPRPLKQDAFVNVVNDLGDRLPKHPQPSKGCFEIDYAYFGSKSSLAAITECIRDSMFRSDDFRDNETRKREFLELDNYYINGSVFVESRFIFCTPPNPHVTIISVQPQQGPHDKLVLAELFTVIYWACRYARRGKRFTSLPIRLVSICDTKARFLSANFSHAYLRCLANIPAVQGLPVAMDVNIGPYYEMEKKEDFQRFMRQLVDVPISPPVYGS